MNLKSFRIAALAAAAAALPVSVLAGPGNTYGNATTFSAPGSLFSLSPDGNSLLVTANLNGPAFYLGLDPTHQLVGIGAVYLVDKNHPGAALSGVTLGPNGGKVNPGGHSWFTLTNGAPAYQIGYDDNGGTNSGGRFTDGAGWIDVATPSLAGKSNTKNLETSGAFAFTFSGGKHFSDYDLGIDYLLAAGAPGQSGQTGRAYFTNDPLSVSAPVPEASSLVSTGLLLALGLCAYGFTARRRKLTAK